MSNVPVGVAQYFTWMNLPNDDTGFDAFGRHIVVDRGVAGRTILQQWPQIKADLDHGCTEPLGCCHHPVQPDLRPRPQPSGSRLRLRTDARNDDAVCLRSEPWPQRRRPYPIPHRVPRRHRLRTQPGRGPRGSWILPQQLQPGTTTRRRHRRAIAAGLTPAI